MTGGSSQSRLNSEKGGVDGETRTNFHVPDFMPPVLNLHRHLEPRQEEEVLLITIKTPNWVPKGVRLI